MKKKWLLVGLSLVVLALVAAGCNAGPVTAGGVVTQQNTGIWVTGEGKVSVIPDVAILNLGVEAQEKTVEQAMQEAREAMTAVDSELDKYGIAKKDRQTQQFSIYPVWQWDDQNKKQILIGYQVTNMVTVKIRKVEDAGIIIDAVAGVGGDYIRINNIDFTVDDPTPYYTEVRGKAMADAKAKAKQLADLGDVGLGKPTYISEGGVSVPIVRDVLAKGAGEAPAPPTPISAGEIEIQLTIQVVYSIR